MTTYLVATDLSPRSDRAVDRAILLARAAGAKLILLNVVDAELTDPVRFAAEDAARKALLAVARTAEGVECEVRVDLGDPVRDILAAAEDAGAELLILGTHRARPFLDLLRETTLERLVRLGRLPVLVVKDAARGPYRRALVAVDFSPASAEAAARAAALAPEAELRGFHAVHVPFEGLAGDTLHGADMQFYVGAAQSELAAWARRDARAALAGATEIEEGDPRAALARQVEKHAPELLALGAHARSGVAPYFLGSFAADMMRAAPCDLLIARG